MRTGIVEFVAVAEAGSFTHAAAQLNTSKSRLSQAVSRLEQDLGVTLLQRTTRRISLTEVGETFLRQCRQGLDLLQLAVDDAQTQQQRVAGPIRINSVGGILGEEWLSPILFRFLEQYPDIIIDLDFSSHRVDLIDGQFDLVVRMGELPDSNLIARELQQLESILCASPDFTARYGQPRHPDELEKFPAALGSITRHRFTRNDEKVDWQSTSRLRCRNGHVMKKAALHGAALVCLPRVYVSRELASGALVHLLPDWQLARSPLSLVYPQHRYRLRRVQLLVEFLTDELRKPIVL